MKLHTPGIVTNPESLVRLKVGLAQQNSARGELQHRLFMSQLSRKGLRQLAEQGIALCSSKQANLPGAGFPAFGMVIHLAAHGMCQELVAVADTQKRNIGFYCLAHPVGCLFRSEERR